LKIIEGGDITLPLIYAGSCMGAVPVLFIALYRATFGSK
jgi:hypothetical protein